MILIIVMYRLSNCHIIYLLKLSDTPELVAIISQIIQFQSVKIGKDIGNLTDPSGLTYSGSPYTFAQNAVITIFILNTGENCRTFLK